jgi:predicted small lipoprotein YifL
MTRSATVFTALVTLAIAGCGQATPPAVPTATVSAARVSETVPYVLYTHCGIDEARLDNRYYEAIDPLSDGNGNPPAGWDNPFQKGTMHRVSTTEIEFQDERGHHVLFRLRPEATGFKRICS